MYQAVNFNAQHIIHKLNYIKKFLILNNLSLVTCESVTGGKIASKITSIPNASKFFKGSFVLYQTNAKNDILKLKIQNPVCQNTTYLLAKNTLIKFNSNICIAVTGYATKYYVKNKFISEPICYYCVWLKINNKTKVINSEIKLPFRTRIKNQNFIVNYVCNILYILIKEDTINNLIK